MSEKKGRRLLWNSSAKIFKDAKSVSRLYLPLVCKIA